jgi:hypothetical protein
MLTMLRKHQARHDKPHPCSYSGCPKRFATPNDRARHEKSVHAITVSGSKSYKCCAKDCNKADKIWPRLDNFKQHLVRMHGAENVEELVQMSDKIFGRQFEPDAYVEEAIKSELHKQEASNRKPSIPRKTKRKRAGDDSQDQHNLQRTRPQLDTSQTTYNPKLLSPQSARTPDQNRLPMQPQREHASIAGLSGYWPMSTPNHAYQPGSTGMSRSVSQQAPSAGHRYIIANGKSQIVSQYPWTPDSMNHNGSTFLMQNTGMMSQHAVWPQNDAEFLSPTPQQGRAHTVANPESFRFTEQQDADLFSDFDPSQFSFPPPQEVVVQTQHFPDTSISPSASNLNTPLTATASTPLINVSTDLDDEAIDGPQFDALEAKEIQNFISRIGEDKLRRHLSKGSSETTGPVWTDTVTLTAVSASSTQPSDAGVSHLSSIHQRQRSQETRATSPSLSSTLAPEVAITSATITAQRRTDNGKINELCQICHREIGRASELKKHMKRHIRPYGCTRDGCGKTFGSKNDWKRHEVTHSKPSGQPQKDGWRCDGSHRDPATTQNCYRFFQGSEDEYKSHLARSEVPNQYVHQYMTSVYIPGQFRGQFWCGLCNAVVASEVALSQTDPKFLDECRDARINHVDRHFMNDRMSIAEWVELGANGATKSDLGLVSSSERRRPASQDDAGG